MNIVSPYILTALVAWLAAQGAKYLIMSLKDGNFARLNRLYLSGNMPSAHSATTVAFASYTALHDGITSGLFGLSLLLAAIVMYDAIMVRRVVGEQGAVISQMLKRKELKDIAPPRQAKGHTPLEAVVGAGLGLVVGVVVFFATN